MGLTCVKGQRPKEEHIQGPKKKDRNLRCRMLRKIWQKAMVIMEKERAPEPGSPGEDTGETGVGSTCQNPKPQNPAVPHSQDFPQLSAIEACGDTVGSGGVCEPQLVPCERLVLVHAEASGSQLEAGENQFWGPPSPELIWFWEEDTERSPLPTPPPHKPVPSGEETKSDGGGQGPTGEDPKRVGQEPVPPGEDTKSDGGGQGPTGKDPARGGQKRGQPRGEHRERERAERRRHTKRWMRIWATGEYTKKDGVGVGPSRRSRSRAKRTERAREVQVATGDGPSTIGGQLFRLLNYGPCSSAPRSLAAYVCSVLRVYIYIDFLL